MQTVITKYIAPTNTRGARIKVTSWLGSKTFSYDYEANCPHGAAFDDWLSQANAQMAKGHPTCQAALEGNWFKVVAKGSLPDGKGYAFIIK